MKQLFATIILLFCSHFAISQDNIQDNINEIKEKLANAKEDTTKVLMSLQLCDYYLFSDLDSAHHFAQQALELSEELEFKRGVARSLTRMGNVFKSTGNFSKALETHLEALKVYDKIHDQIGVAASYNNIAEVLKEQHDYRHALDYYFMTQEIFEKIIKNGRSVKKNETSLTLEEEIKYKRYLATTLLNIGDAYDRMNQLDSALIFQNRAYEIASLIKDKEIIGAILSNLGSIQLKKGNIDLAISFFRTGIPVMSEINDKQFLSNTYHGMSQAYQRKQENDSAIYYGRLALISAAEGKFLKEELNADTLLSRLFEVQKNSDSALHYLKLGRNIADSISNEEKIREVQNLHIAVQLHQEELKRAKKEWSNKMQLLAITIFLVVFFITLLIISRRKTKPRVLEYIGIVGLLVLFEFITVFIHPYLEKVTNHTPIYILLISVGVALLLAPLDHRLTDWVKVKLAKKRGKSHSRKTRSTQKQTIT
jgi:tetratricopeptide (TPR) repeat protein